MANVDPRALAMERRIQQRGERGRLVIIHHPASITEQIDMG